MHRPIFWRMLAVLALATPGTCATNPGVERIADAPPLDRGLVAGIGADRFAAASFTASDGRILRYRLLSPPNPRPGRRYPLVVQFHGSGAIGTDNRAQIEKDVAARAWALPEIRAAYPAFVLVPQFSERSANYDNPATPHMAVAGPELAVALQLVDALLETHPIDRRRIYVSGFSMGGSTSWLAALARPDLFAAAVPVSAVAPDRGGAAALTALPVLALHGDADAENPIASDRQLLAEIRRAGGQQARLREYAGLGHQPPGDFIPGHWWRDWLFRQQQGIEEESRARP